MGIRETNISKKIQLAVAKYGARLIRNNTGLFRTLDGKRKTRAGLGTGTSDLIGWTPVIITPDMVGRTIAVFTAIEVKTPDGTQKDNQGDFIKLICKSGGFAGFATTPEGALDIIDIDKFRKKNSLSML